MVRKVFRFDGFYGRCKNCNTIFKLDLDLLRQQELKRGHIPLKARSAVGLIFCPNCEKADFTIDYQYHQAYRKRCRTCKEMFEDECTFGYECPKCYKTRMEAWVLI